MSATSKCPECGNDVATKKCMGVRRLVVHDIGVVRCSGSKALVTTAKMIEVTVTVNSTDAAIAARWLRKTAFNLEQCAGNDDIAAERGPEYIANLEREAEALERVASRLYS